MIGYCHYPCAIIALLLIHTHPTIQIRFVQNSEYAAKKLRKEKPGLLGTPGKYGDVACDKLTASEKQHICDEVMRDVVADRYYMVARADEILKRYKWIRVEKFLDEKSSLPVPPMADASDPYTCRKIPIEGLGYEKRMFWCRNRVFELQQEWNYYDTTSSESDSSESESSESDSSESEAEKTHLVKTNSNSNTNSNWMTDSNRTNSRLTTDSNATKSDLKTAEVRGFFLAGNRRKPEKMFVLIPSSTNSQKVTPWAVLKWVSVVGRATYRCGYCH